MLEFHYHAQTQQFSLWSQELCLNTTAFSGRPTQIHAFDDTLDIDTNTHKQTHTTHKVEWWHGERCWQRKWGKYTIESESTRGAWGLVTTIGSWRTSEWRWPGLHLSRSLRPWQKREPEQLKNYEGMKEVLQRVWRVKATVVSVVIGALRALLWHSMYDRLLASCSLFLCVGRSEGHFACYGSADLMLRACSCEAMTSAYVQSVSPALSSHW